MSIDQSNIDTIIGRPVHGADGQKIGDVGQIYLDDATGKPEWATVRTGLFGTKESFVPVAEAQITDEACAFRTTRMPSRTRPWTGSRCTACSWAAPSALL